MDASRSFVVSSIRVTKLDESEQSSLSRTPDRSYLSSRREFARIIIIIPGYN